MSVETSIIFGEFKSTSISQMWHYQKAHDFLRNTVYDFTVKALQQNLSLLLNIIGKIPSWITSYFSNALNEGWYKLLWISFPWLAHSFFTIEMILFHHIYLCMFSHYNSRLELEKDLFTTIALKCSVSRTLFWTSRLNKPKI